MKANFFSVLLLTVLAISSITFFNVSCSGESSSKNANGTKKSSRQLEIEKQFSGYDGSHYELTELIKNAMDDPSSYEHIQTSYLDMTDFIIVKTVYSGKNAFGGRVKRFVRAKVSNSGQIMEILEEGPGS